MPMTEIRIAATLLTCLAHVQQFIPDAELAQLKTLAIATVDAQDGPSVLASIVAALPSSGDWPPDLHEQLEEIWTLAVEMAEIPAFWRKA